MGISSRWPGPSPSLLQRVLVVALLLCCATPWLAGQEGATDLRILDKTRVFYGKPNSYQKPALIKFDKVAPHIPEYRRIREKDLKPSDAEYQLLAGEGTKAFRKVVKEVAKLKGYDLVVDAKAVVPPRGIVLPDLTIQVIKKLGG